MKNTIIQETFFEPGEILIDCSISNAQLFHLQCHIQTENKLTNTNNMYVQSSTGSDIGTYYLTLKGADVKCLDELMKMEVNLGIDVPDLTSTERAHLSVVISCHWSTLHLTPPPPPPPPPQLECEK